MNSPFDSYLSGIAHFAVERKDAAILTGALHGGHEAAHIVKVQHVGHMHLPNLKTEWETLKITIFFSLPTIRGGGGSGPPPIKCLFQNS